VSFPQECEGNIATREKKQESKRGRGGTRLHILDRSQGEGKLNTHTHTHTHRCMNTHKHTHTDTHTYNLGWYSRTHTHTHTHTHTQTHAHTHTQEHAQCQEHDPNRITEWTLISTRVHHRSPQEGSCNVTESVILRGRYRGGHGTLVRIKRRGYSAGRKVLFPLIKLVFVPVSCRRVFHTR